MADPSDYQKDPRPPVPSQLSTSLPGINTFITTHDPSSGKSKVHSQREGDWTAFDDKQMAFNPVYTMPFATDMTDEKDLEESDKLTGSGKMGLVRQGGTVSRYVDFSPGYQCLMHRTQSCDFGIVIHGTIEMVLDDDSATLMRQGDVAVQRATMHAWRNPSKDTWARMIFILSQAQPLEVAGQKLGEDLGSDNHGIPSSH